MKRETKASQLQLRVSAAEKADIKRAAKHAGMPVSAWVLSCLLSAPRREIERLFAALDDLEQASYALAEFNDLLTRMRRDEFTRVWREPVRLPASLQMQNQVAAMIELCAHRCEAGVPTWIRDIPPLAVPVFATALASLRLHLLVHTPPPFRRRNLFVDSSLGDRI